MKDLDIDEEQIPHTGRYSRGRGHEEEVPQSDFTSRVGQYSSEVTVDSDLLMTYQ